MRARITLATLLAGMLWANAARCADETRRWEIDAGVSYVALGKRFVTGGAMPLISARHSWILTRSASLSLGAEGGVFGLGADERSVGVLAGPTLGGAVRPWSGPIALGLTLRTGIGRIPVANAWGLRLRYIGVFPALALSADYYTAKLVAISASVSCRVVNTIALPVFTSWEPSIGGRLWW